MSDDGADPAAALSFGAFLDRMKDPAAADLVHSIRGCGLQEWAAGGGVGAAPRHRLHAARPPTARAPSRRSL